MFVFLNLKDIENGISLAKGRKNASDTGNMPSLSYHHCYKTTNNICRAVARALIGGCIFIYSGSARLISFEMKLISKEVSRAELEYMNIHTPISVLATALNI